MKSYSTILAVVFLVFTTVFVPASALSAPTAAEYGTVLNLSGKQRMLTQKMSKEILLVALEVDSAANLDNLKKTAALFDKTLKGLKAGDADLKLPPTTNGRIVRQLDKTAAIWVDFNQVVQQVISSGKVTPENVAVVAEKNLPLLKSMNRCVKLYEKDASKSGLKSDPGLAVTINLAGKQRMLTQKMSKEFYLVAYGHAVEDNQLNLQETTTLFERTLKGLLDGDATLDLPGTKNEAIRVQLKVVEGLWGTFKPQILTGLKGKDAIGGAQLKEIASTNLPLLKQMNKAVGMYEKEAAK